MSTEEIHAAAPDGWYCGKNVDKNDELTTFRISDGIAYALITDASFKDVTYLGVDWPEEFDAVFDEIEK